MPREVRPALEARDHRFCIVAARFNESLVRRLVDAAVEVLRGRGALEGAIEVWWVPGSFELPLACAVGGARRSASTPCSRSAC